MAGFVFPPSGGRRNENARTSLVRRIRQLYLDRFVLPRLGNVDGNRRLWDAYAGAWRQDEAYLDVELSEADAEAWRERHVHLVGDEWGTPADVDRVLEDFVFPYLRDDATVAEIGVGGGRIAARVASRVAELWGFDISKVMLQRAREALAAHQNVRLVLLKEASLPADLDGRFAFAYAFDVFPHLDLHVQYRYLRQLHTLLEPGGHALVHTSNLRAPAGWERFASQPVPSIRGFFFVTPETVDLLAEHAGFVVERRSQVDPSNFYYRRDYVALLRKSG
jgi:SAM-dependent methyltransferase